MLAGVLSVELLEGLRDALVHARAAGRAEALIERLVDQRMGEAKLPDAARMTRPAARRRPPPPSGPAAGSRRSRASTPAARDQTTRPITAAERQDLERLIAEALDATLDHLAHALGQRDRRGAIDAPAPAGLVEHQRAGLREPAQDLPHEERVAVRSRWRSARPARPRPRSSSWPATAVMICATSSTPRPCKAMRWTPSIAAQVGEHRGQRMVLAEVRVAIGDDHEQRAVLDRPHEVLEQRHRLTRRPNAGRRAPGTRARSRATSPEQPRDRGEQQVALGLGIR